MQVLDTLLEISVYATVIFAVTMLIKRLLKNRMSPFLHYAVWALFILRLLLPVTIQSPVQLLSFPAAQAAAGALAALPETERENAWTDTASGAEATDPETDGLVPATQTAPTQAGVFADETKQAISLSTALLIVWLTGAGIGIGYIAFLYVRLQKSIVKHAVRPAKRLRVLYQEVRQELGIRANVPLVCQYGLTSPGILFPACVLMPMESLAAMRDEQVKNTLRHELIHYKRGDHMVSVLLSLLNAVYWFNPIVWIAVRQIRADMETVCDSAVVRGMSAKQKGDYATLILDLFSRSNYRQVVLGMAYGKSKSVIEKRIKGVFMNDKSKWSAKIICFTCILVLLTGCFTTACSPKTQGNDDVAIIGGADGPTAIFVSNDAAAAADEAAEPTPTAAPEAISPLAQKLGVPTPWRYSEWSTDKELLLNGNLNVTLPNVDAVPVASATCRYVTETDLMNAVTAFFGKEVTFTYAPQDTKEYAEQWIANSQETYDSVINGTCENKLASFEKSVKEQYAPYSEMAKTAPSAAENKQIAPGFTQHMSETGNSYMGFRGVTELNGTEYLVSASYSDRASAVNINEFYENQPLYYSGTYRSEPAGLSVTKEQAVALATAMAEKLDSGLSLNHVMTVGLFVAQGEENTWEHPWAWQCIFMREVNGVGTAYDSRDVASDMETMVVNGRAYEALEITVDDRGICNVHWINPMTVDSITNPDATLMPFAEIEAKLADLIREKYDYNITREKDSTHELYILRAELGMMRIGVPGSITYTLEPVWNFFIGFDEKPDYESNPDLLRAAYDGDPTYWNSLTISAIDGRVIDRDRGY
ncbi:MAG: DUF6034 family protein [Christensenella sp.]